MTAGAPTCSTCGGLNTTPQATHCRFCGQALRPPAGYGAPPGGYGVPPAQPYGGPHANAYGMSGQNVPVSGFGGGQPFHGAYVNRSRWASGWSTFFWVRLAIAAIAIGISLLGACVSALSH